MPLSKKNNANSIGYLGGGTLSSSDLLAIANSLSAVMGDWKANNMDYALRPYYQAMGASQISSRNIDLNAILEQVQQYNSAATLEQIQANYNFLTVQPISNIQTVLNNLVETGLYPYLQQAQQTVSRFAEDGFSAPANLGQARPVSSGAPSGMTAVAMAGRAGGVPSGCTMSNGLAFAAGTAFAVIAIMSGPAAVLEYAAVWGAISLWGGTLTAAWSIVNGVFCGF